MKLHLHPRVSTVDPAHRLSVWVGAFQTTQAPAISWTLNGVQVQPATTRAITSARTGSMLPDPNIERAFTGVFEFSGLSADTFYQITASDNNVSADLLTRTLPDRVPTGLDNFFNVLLVSCFHAEEDGGGQASRIASSLSGPLRPHLTILSGDQVYLDLPTLQNFPNQIDWLADKFEADYVRNWSETTGYAGVLRAAPSVALPDDHEYWNNFPHVSPVIQNSFTQTGRDNWTAAAQAAFSAFQTTAPAGSGDPISFDVPPLSFFVADTRTHKDPNQMTTLDQNTRDQISDWVAHVIAGNHFPVLVTGQSLFREAAGLGGNVTDFEMPNYSDYDDLMRKLAELADAGRPLLCLTGDVHWGRVTSVVDLTKFRPAMFEIISSPTALVTSVGFDQLHQFTSAIGGFFGAIDPFPRHASADAAPIFLASNALSGRFACQQMHAQKGNHLALLRFRQSGGSVELRVVYWPWPEKGPPLPPVELNSITLTPF
ncbi:MAG: metallophosphatase [Pyrinomonadaceae bacterium]